MDHLIVTCKCGQRMRVTDDRIGRTGHCVKCGRKMRITKNRVAPLSTMPTTESPSDAAAQQARGRQSPAPNMMMLAAVGLILILIIACALVLRSGQRRQAEQPQKGVSAPVTRSIPEPRQSPRTASTTTETAIRCDKFDVIAHLDGDTVRFRLETDLPDYTEVMVGVSRSYYEADGTEYAPAYMNKKSTVGEWHTLQPVSVADHVFEDLLQERVDLMAKFGESFKVARVENEIEVSFVVPINQSNPVFGEKNVNLHGTKVSRTGLRTVEGEKKLRKPLARRPSASYTSAKAHYASLEIGGKIQAF